MEQVKTVYDLKREYYKKNPDGHWFDRDTLNFFGERMSDMYLYKGTTQVVSCTGEKHECYALRHTSRTSYPGGALKMQKVAYFDVDTMNEVFP